MLPASLLSNILLFRHFIYFSNKYPQVFEREFVDNYIKHKINTFDKNILLGNPQRDTNQFTFDDSKLQEKLIVLETKLDSMNMNEIYSSFYFYFLNSIDYLFDGTKLKEIIFVLISKFIFLNDLINLKVKICLNRVRGYKQCEVHGVKPN